MLPAGREVEWSRSRMLCKAASYLASDACDLGCERRSRPCGLTAQPVTGRLLVLSIRGDHHHQLACPCRDTLIMPDPTRSCQIPHAACTWARLGGTVHAATMIDAHELIHC